jgi:hypothetical protein
MSNRFLVEPAFTYFPKVLCKPKFCGGSHPSILIKLQENQDVSEKKILEISPTENAFKCAWQPCIISATAELNFIRERPINLKGGVMVLF